MHKKYLRTKKRFVLARKKHVRRLRLWAHHPVAIPVGVFFALVILSIVAVQLLGGRQKVVATDARIVIISHDHVEQTVPTRETSVKVLLDKLHIKINAGDVVEPSIDAPINQDGFRINIYRGAPVEVVDGGKKTYAFSAATTPRSIAKQADVTVYPEDNLDTLPTTNFLKEGAIGRRVVIDRATPIHVNLYGAQVDMRTHAKTVGDLLKDKNIQLSKGDSVKPAAATPIKADQQIFILRKGTKIVTKTETIAMPVKTINDPSLSLGTSAVRQQGSPGKKVVTYQIKTQNGKEVGRSVIQTVVVQSPVQQIVVKGTAVVGPAEISAKIVYWANRYGVSSSWMLQIARCESNFNPGSVNAYGYKGLYQYSDSTFAGYASNAGIPGASIWDPDAQAHATAWALANGHAGAWACA